ncbi:MAG: extracellular solute-binding protein [Propionibacteriaceae bacterium]|jgi:lactose/L-arabinose transport system substrate-binding protein|nr:extracellular solute-binding protein [Propionibacteriaceae bacterium]
MRSSWKIAAIGLVTATAMALSACGGSTQPSSGHDTAVTGDSLTVWAWDPTFNVYAMKEAGKVYQKDHPNFTLNVVEVPWEDVQTKLATYAQSGQLDELPDIFLMQNNAFQKNATNYPQLFTALTDAGVDYTQYSPSVVNYSTVDGVHYGVPFDNGAAIAAYRTDVLKEAGYTLQDFTDITWSDFMTKATDVLAKTGKPMLSGLSKSVDLIMMMVISAGGSLFTEDGKPVLVDNEILGKAVAQYQQMVKAGVFLEVNGWDQYVNGFVNDGVLGVINGCWILGSVQTATNQEGDWGLTNLPKLDGVSSATNYSTNGGSSWAISSKANFGLAADFLKATFAGSTELYDTILPSSGALANWIPAGKSSVYEKPQSFFGGQPIYSTIVDFSTKVPKFTPGAYLYEAIDALSVAVTKTLSGGDAKAALQEAQDAVEFAQQ